VHRIGDSAVGPEVLVGYEGGYRYQPNARFYFDLSGYVNHYRGILSWGESVPGLRVDPVTGLTFETLDQRLVNGISGHIIGFEALGDWRVYRWLSLQGWISRCEFTRARGVERSAELVNGVIPTNQGYLRAFVDLSEKWSLSLAGRFVDSMIAYRIPAYSNLDSRVSWKPFPDLEYAIVVKDMFSTSRVEFPNSGFRKIASERIERRYFGQVSWKF
jgi:outer membrane receptor protein involved in Fe transport